MRILPFLLGSLLCLSSASVFANCYSGCDYQPIFCWENIEAACGLNIGYRNAKMDFSDSYPTQIVSGGATPITLVSGTEKITWRDLNIFELGGKFLISQDQWFLRGKADWGCIGTGKGNALAQQTLINAVPGSTIVFGPASTKSKPRGYLYDFSIGLGYEFYLACDRLMLAPVAGYSYEKQKLFDNNILGTTSQFFPLIPLRLTDLIDGGKRSSRFEWYGPWVGLDFAYSIDCAWKFFGGYEFHYDRVRLSSFANTFLIETAPFVLPPFTERMRRQFSNNDAYGQDATLGFSYQSLGPFWSDWVISLSGNYQYLRTNKGSVKKFSSSQVITPFSINAVSNATKIIWQSWAIKLDLAYVF